jgi:phosphate uptake regulator
MDQNCAVLATATQVENMSQCLAENKFEAGHAFSSHDDKTDQMHNSVMRMLTRGLEETDGMFLLTFSLSLCSTSMIFYFLVLDCARSFMSLAKCHLNVCHL